MISRNVTIKLKANSAPEFTQIIEEQILQSLRPILSRSEKADRLTGWLFEEARKQARPAGTSKPRAHRRRALA